MELLATLPNTRKRRKAPILTNTPEKNELANEQEKSKKRSKAIKENKKNKIVKEKVLQEDSPSSSSDEEYFCIICCESYSESKSGEQWIQCPICKGWTHERCVFWFKF